MKHVLGIDLGTTSLKTVLYDERGRAVAAASREYPLSQPKNGWAEQEPRHWVEAAFATIREVREKSGVEASAIAGIGLSGQMHGLVMLNAKGEVLRPAILWCDQRTGDECADIEQTFGRAELIQESCNPALTGFTLSKILWVRKHEPACFAACEHILLPKDYLRYCLSGDMATDVSDASGMQLLQVAKRCWSTALMSAFDLPERLFAKVYESPEITGTLSPEAAQTTGLTTKTYVVAGAGDNAASAVGTGAVVQGAAFATIGTSGVVYVHTDELHLDPGGRVHTFCCAVPKAWHVMGVTQAAGLSMQWMRNLLYENDAEYQQINKEILATPPGAEGLIYLPYLMGERTPHLDSRARGAFIGLSAMHTRAHMARAVMEGVTYSLKDCLGILAQMDVLPPQMTLCGGGAKSEVWRQMAADVLNLPVNGAPAADSAALGAAILALVGGGFYADVPSACEQMLRFGSGIEPKYERQAAYSLAYNAYRLAYPGLREAFDALAALR